VLLSLWGMFLRGEGGRFYLLGALLVLLGGNICLLRAGLWLLSALLGGGRFCLWGTRPGLSGVLRLLDRRFLLLRAGLWLLGVLLRLPGRRFCGLRVLLRLRFVRLLLLVFLPIDDEGGREKQQS
jgi:hypothetical protein